MNLAFFEGNSCSGTTGNIKKGAKVYNVDYFGRVFSVDEFISFAIGQLNWIEGSITVMGSSFGGHLSIYLVYRLIMTKNPLAGRIAKLVLTGTPPTNGAESYALAFNTPAETIEEGGRGIMEMLSAPDVMTIDEAKRFFLPTIGDHRDAETEALIKENIEQLTANASFGKTRHDILTTLAPVPTEVEMLQRIVQSMPVVMLHAELDPVINGEYVRKVAADIGAEFHLIANAPHYSHWTHPEEFLKIVTRTD
jgi:pimeloyl-ACP methyl ester carboxylesterase